MKIVLSLITLFGLVVCSLTASVDYPQNTRFHLGKMLYDATYSDQPKSDVQVKWFKQHLDHFQPQDNHKWKQRYFISTKYGGQDKSSPVFLEIGGEGAIKTEKFETSYMADNLAREFKAYSIQLEHRFYGKSQPKDDWSVENLQYLTSEQALADLANFIVTMNATHPELAGRKWIVFGGSYPGSLAAWMRLKYPHLVSGAIASSAPVQAQLDFPEYMEVVSRSLGRECSEQVRSAFAELDAWTKTTKSVPSLMKMFNLCNFDLADAKTRANFFSNLIDDFAGVVQYNEDNRKGSNVTIDMICSVMSDDHDSASNVMKLAKVNKLINSEQKNCENVTYASMVASLQNVTIDFDGAGRQWTYQTCNEFGYYQTTTSSQQPFPSVLDLKFFTDMCVDVYGPKFNADYIQKRVARTNMMYGGRNLIADRIFLLNGSIDPWHALGLTDYQYQNTTAYYIQGTAHCADMYATSPNDKPDLIKARSMISQRIKLFLQ